jgi:D-alanyl-D-alanine carboxypeptidase/D-alanyl-D-alanine-endopeptidase (penicillin-binding protein 4)
VTTGPIGSGDKACIYGSEYSTVQFVRGTIPAGFDEFSIRGSIPDPARLCGQLLSKALETKGFQFSIRRQWVGKRSVFHTTYSPMVKEIVHWTNQKSINIFAEHLLKKIG